VSKDLSKECHSVADFVPSIPGNLLCSNCGVLGLYIGLKTWMFYHCWPKNPNIRRVTRLFVYGLFTSTWGHNV